MGFVVVIPARYESSRLPGKPLMDILGKPMIQWTWQQAKQSGAERIIIATESEKVAGVCRAFGADVCLTGEHHQSGTERIAEVIELCELNEDDIIVNVQGDEPMLPVELIHQVVDGLEQNPHINMATLCEPIESIETLFDPHAVKVSRDINQCAINFSRAPLPWARDNFAKEPKTLPDNWHYKRHIGLYAYRAAFVKQYVAWPECDLEHVEKLEQLRVLWHGEKILVLDALTDAGVGVDTAEDLKTVQRLLSLSVDGQ
ncbi:3-deoxy-manno-octulosonate cytidylyltransferase [Thiomicrorhabdus heinhorstiae]|uniref:3-deoxy-manno-octulosonate cytidylyltransferase n=1 Tax=Thiomicrorhabdus heinhorstiae TaxID=2748010 RepID=A0ABS0BY97_9GAMM|nr:3-deoxy-manno-octulosonate cytidylyltransferase [Thiomicrorhabdus heinhorstiae]MBF6057047.1 3-deoxy-manno-octulosonate cytidylyltransferase [Thiomicrorhabdus heinhorstiae]